MNYKRPKILFSGHLETIYPALFRKVKDITYKRERIHTPDGDFLDLDWVKNGSKSLVIISHGLEGSSDRAYMKGMARIMANHQYDVLAWNYRGCSEEMNKQLRFYHSGATDDLDLVVAHAKDKGYDEINLVGFSLGGNLTLKYLGEKKRPEIHRAITFSVPLDLHSSCDQISKPGNVLYSNRFLRNLKKKVRQKAQQMPELKTNDLHKIKTLIDFDDQYTAPIHGFKNAVHYYESCSAIGFLENIKIPTLIVNAANDPFLSDECYPRELLKDHRYVKLEVPRHGGHVGFASFSGDNTFWSEKRALHFIDTGK
ncbi:MAG: alpha/beta fold hydrolase [Fulvivirga sp.]|nr:alpha/beta fold hydrolase [Fulvivirga sp.]